MYKPRVISEWPEQVRDPEFLRRLSEVELSEADIQKFAEAAVPVPVCRCGCGGICQENAKSEEAV